MHENLWTFSFQHRVRYSRSGVNFALLFTPGERI
jgi:hypothetical protein